MPWYWKMRCALSEFPEEKSYKSEQNVRQQSIDLNKVDYMYTWSSDDWWYCSYWCFWLKRSNYHTANRNQNSIIEHKGNTPAEPAPYRCASHTCKHRLRNRCWCCQCKSSLPNICSQIWVLSLKLAWLSASYHSFILPHAIELGCWGCISGFLVKWTLHHLLDNACL